MKEQYLNYSVKFFFLHLKKQVVRQTYGKVEPLPSQRTQCNNQATQAKIAAEGSLLDLSGLLQGNATC